MPSGHVLRLRRTDSEGDHLLVNIFQSGSHSLDLKLEASEGEHVYPGKIKEANVKSLQASNYSGNLDEWKAVLRYALLQERPEDVQAQALAGLETVAAISGTTLTITLRKNISGITQRLGSIKLEEDDEHEISVFEWAATAVASADDLRVQLQTLQMSVNSQQDQVARLNQQLDDLVKAKKEHEDALLKKFAALLNAKKLKIRDQQRLLAGAKVDPEAAAAISESRNGGSSRLVKAGTSRKGKRKANGAVEPEPDGMTADGLDATDDDDDDDLGRREETPQNSDRDATEDEDSDASRLDAAPVPSQASRRGAGSKGKALRVAKSKAKGGPAMEVEDEGEDEGEPPPRRALPFQKKGAGKVEEEKRPEPPKAAAEEEDDDDETDDDEL